MMTFQIAQLTVPGDGRTSPPAFSDPSIFVLVLIDAYPPLPPLPTGLCTCRSFISSLLCLLGHPSLQYVFITTQRSFLPIFDPSLFQPHPIYPPHPTNSRKTSFTMFAYASLAAFIVSAAFVHAEVVPTAPGPGDIFKEGGQCSFTWDADTSGVWKTMNVQLMTGSNTGMVHITSTPFSFSLVGKDTQ